MPHATGPAAPRTIKSEVALALTFAAGFVDVVGYIAFYRMFTAHMTGNTVHFAMDLEHHHWREAFVAGLLVLAFVIGSVVGRCIIEVGARLQQRSIASITLAIEALLVAAVAASNGNVLGRSWPVLMLAAAMGLQTATLTKVGPLTVHTTFVTGMLNKFAQLISRVLVLTYDVVCGRARARNARQKVWRQAGFILAIWVLYLAGGLAGAVADSALGRHALFLPSAILASAVLVDRVRPLALEEESPVPASR